ncbi:MAG: PDZ domain-containing protein, partial [Gordonibacter sp.]
MRSLRGAAQPPRALVAAVVPESPADDAGFEPGCFVSSVDGRPLRDIIDWRWLAADDEVVLGYIDLDGDAGEVELVREPGEDWGFEFDGVVFDGVKQCRNACTFCFMRQLPEDMRPSLTLRD